MKRANLFPTDGSGRAGGGNPPPIASVGSDDVHDVGVAEGFMRQAFKGDPGYGFPIASTGQPSGDYAKAQAWREHDRASQRINVRNLGNDAARTRR